MLRAPGVLSVKLRFSHTSVDEKTFQCYIIINMYIFYKVYKFLYLSIQEPMEVFQRQGTILRGSDAKKIVKNYNKIAKVLLEFEMLYYRGWLRQV